MNNIQKGPVVIELDLTDIGTNDQLIDLFDRTFGFPEWFGRNFNALADCLFSFYFPAESQCRTANENGSETILAVRMAQGNEPQLLYIANLLGYVNLKLSETAAAGRFSIRPIID